MADFRELCAELVEYLALLDEPPHELADRARAALAAAPDGPAVPEGREPASVVRELSDEELLNLWASSPCIDEPHGGISYARAAIAADRARRPAPAVAEGEVEELARLLRLDAEFERSDGLPQAAARFDRAADLLEQLAARPAVAEGEVEELVAWLRTIAAEVQAEDYATVYSFLLPTRAADLLEQLAARPVVVPVPVSERLPGAGDCDAEGRCWWFLPAQQLEILRQCDSWSLRKHTPSPRDSCHWTHWLPAHALPLPSGEVEA